MAIDWENNGFCIENSFLPSGQIIMENNLIKQTIVRRDYYYNSGPNYLIK